MKRRTFLQGSVALATAVTMGTAVFAQGAKTLVIAATATPPGIDNEKDFSAESMDCYNTLYDTLVAFETVPDSKYPDVRREDTEPHPERPDGRAMKGMLAESWTISEDGKSIAFNLRSGVKSNWGNELTAEDVRYSWERKLKAGGVGGFFCGLLGITSIDQVVADGQTITFNLPNPTPMILTIHANPAANILDAAKMKEMSSEEDPWAAKFLQSDTAGFGPYKVQQLVRGQQAVFVRHEEYWGEAPFFDAVVMREVPTSATRLSLLQGGAVDIAKALSPREANTIAEVPGITVQNVDSSYMLWFHLNTKFAPFDNPQVRQAINFLIPQEEIVKSVFYGMASPMTAAFPKRYPMVNHELFAYNYNVEKAKELLKAAGLPDGFKSTLSFDAGNPVQEAVALIFQTNARDAGIEITLEKLPTGVFFDKVSRRETEMDLYLDMPITPDPNYSSTLYFTKDSFVNYNGWSDPKVEELLTAARTETDDTKRVAIYDDVQKIIMDQAPWGFVVYPDYIMARKSDVGGYVYYTNNGLRYADFNRA